MAQTQKKTPVWKFNHRQNGHERKANLTAYWEVFLDPISDDYTTQEIDATELFNKWEIQVSEKFLDGLIPIHWGVRCEEAGIFEVMPFQFQHFEDIPQEDFLTFFTWPVDSETGKHLNWLLLPVVDKMWKPGNASKGGFIQQATGWKPAILQPYVYLPTLTSALRHIE